MKTFDVVISVTDLPDCYAIKLFGRAFSGAFCYASVDAAVQIKNFWNSDLHFCVVRSAGNSPVTSFSGAVHFPMLK